MKRQISVSLESAKLFQGRWKQVVLAFWLVLPFSIQLEGQLDSFANDPLYLQEVVITDFQTTRKIESPNSITTLGDLSSQYISGVGNLLSSVPGVFVDQSLGEVFSRTYSRGISLSAEDDIGWYYTSLQEDGLPVTAVQFQHFTPDFFVRPSIGHAKLEVLKGGKSGILAPNAPGGVVNFEFQNHGSSYRGHDVLTGGIHANGQPIFRLDGYANGPIGQEGWSWGYDYVWRIDKGARDVDYTWHNGGVVNLKLMKKWSRGVWSIRGKYLNDKVNRHIGLAAVNWQDPVPAFNQDFNTTSLLPAGFEGSYQDPRNASNSIEYDPANGIRTKDFSIQSNFDIGAGDWIISNKTKYSDKSIDWQSAIGGQPLGLENFLTYFISGDQFPAGLVNIEQVSTGQRLALVNNVEAFGVFQGLPPGFEYLEGGLPNDAVMGTGAWKKDDNIEELMSEVRVSRQIGNSSLTFGSFYARSSVDIFTNASFIYSTYEPNPQLIRLSIENPGDPVRYLSDDNGLSNYGALFYEGADIDVNQFSFFIDSKISLSQKTNAEVGLRHETIGHDGDKDRYRPLDVFGGLDGDPQTSYDNGLLSASNVDPIDFSYDYLSYSAAISHMVSDVASAYIRYSRAHKAPELNYYINNFANVDINQPGTVQNIYQVEGGFKYFGQATNVIATGFYSRLTNVPYSEFVFDGDANSIFYTPTQFNSSKTIGLELEWNQRLNDLLAIDVNATFQNAEVDDFVLYDAAGTVETNDDQTINFSGNDLPHNPSVIFGSTLTLNKDKFQGTASWSYMGSRKGNFENSFTMGAFSVFNATLNFELTDRAHVGLNIQNIFNSSGIINFFGPNEFGSSANQATAEFISNNPNASFVVFPILPRTFALSFGYRVQK